MTSSQMAPRAAAVQERAEALLSRIPEDEGGRALVRRAFEDAERAHAAQVRKSGEPYILHPIAVAALLHELRMDPATVAAGLLHDVLEDTPVSLEELRRNYPDPVPALVDGVTKISRIHFDTSRDHQVENLRKIIIAMARDIRVVVIKLCDRLHNMRTLKHLPEDKREAISRESMDIYAPLANRLGMVKLKSELEDLAMMWLYPKEYRELAAGIELKRREREEFVKRSIAFLRNYLAELGFTGIEISGRPKHFWSIFQKMRHEGLTFDEIFDLHGLRIICDTRNQCYEILGAVHGIWHAKPGRFKDYIGTPKPNGYRSLHTTVVGYEGVVTEIQIRTREMHEVADFGVAAHWMYKEGKPPAPAPDKQLDWLKQLSEWIQDPGDPNSVLDVLKKDVFADVVLCFTPAGDVVELPAGAGPIDFAYAIHTKVGHTCVGARVNKRIVPLKTQLAHGDTVEIITNPQGHPSRDWLDVAVTGRARSKVKHWLKSQQMATWVADGRSKLEKLLAERHIPVTRTELDKALETILEPYRLKTTDDLLAEIGFGTISALAALTRMNPEWSKTSRPPRQTTAAKKKAPRVGGAISVEGFDDMQMRLANCCRPIPGDSVVGFVTRGRGISVHKSACPTIARAREDAEDAARVLPAQWNDTANVRQMVFIRVEASDRTGLLAEISGQFSNRNVSIIGCKTETDEVSKIAVFLFKADVSNLFQLDAVLADLRQIRGVYKAQRTTRGGG